MKNDTYQSIKLTESDRLLLAASMFDDSEKQKQEELARQREIEEQRNRRRATVVTNEEDLLYKYSEFNPTIKSDRVILKNEFPTVDLPQFIFDCNKLGLKAMIDSTGELTWNADH